MSKIFFFDFPGTWKILDNSLKKIRHINDKFTMLLLKPALNISRI